MSARRRTAHDSLVGEKVVLRLFTRSDLPHVQKWSKDPEIRKLTGDVAPMTRADAERFYRVLRTDKDRIWFAIVLKEGNRVIGESLPLAI